MVLEELDIDLAPLLASAGIAGLALGFGAQSLVKDILAGLFMLLEDQYGVGDIVDVGEAVGTVEAVGLRVTTIRDATGRASGTSATARSRVGNKSQGWASVIVDMPIGFVRVEEATEVMRRRPRRWPRPAVRRRFPRPPRSRRESSTSASRGRSSGRWRECIPRTALACPARCVGDLARPSKRPGSDSQIAATRRPVIRGDLGQRSDPGGPT